MKYLLIFLLAGCVFEPETEYVTRLETVRDTTVVYDTIEVDKGIVRKVYITDTIETNQYQTLLDSIEYANKLHNLRLQALKDSLEIERLMKELVTQ